MTRDDLPADPAAALTAALDAAGEAHGLPTYYRDCVRPLLRMPRTQWPQCCGRGCDPCMDTLTAVARRVTELLDAPDA